jgi:hypothetical protein
MLREAQMSAKSVKRLFLSYGRGDASALAERLTADLGSHGIAGFQQYEVWRDRPEIRAGLPWADQIANAIDGTDATVAVLSPRSVRRGPKGALSGDSVCLDEITYARYGAGKPIIPVMAIPCQPPLDLFRLHYVDFTHSHDSAGTATPWRNSWRRLPMPCRDASVIVT